MEATASLRSLGFDGLIIALTGNVMDDDISEFMRAGADAVLAKPLRSQQLGQILSYVEDNGYKTVVNKGQRLLFYDTKWSTVDNNN